LYFSEGAAMQRSSTIFLQAVIVLIGLGVLALMLFEPQVEGRNANATQFEVYFQDPMLAYAYIASIPFFVTLYQAFKLLRYARQNQMFSQQAVKALWIIKYCALALIGFVVVGEIFILLSDSHEPPAVVMGVLTIFGSIVIATAAAMFERILQNAVDIKSENDLTV
jgi:hypothetical protein